MKATDLLEKQHRVVSDLFKRIESAKEDSKKAELFEELASSLAAHDAIEREIFYPACEKGMGLTDLLGEALAEHGVVEFTLYLANQALGNKDFDFKMTVLKEIVEHHVEEEEKEFFPKVEKALGAELLESLCVQMEARFEEAKQADFRVPLRENLIQVLGGALETSPKKRASSKSPSHKSAPKKATSHGKKSNGASHSAS